MNNIILLIVGMAVVTYIPRLVPLAMMSKLKVPIGLRRFLKYIPATALGALILPGIFTATPDKPIASIVGIAFAFIYGWLKGGIIITVLGSILVTYVIFLI